MICHYYTEPLYFFFTSDLPPLLYYSHIPVSILALVVGFFIYFNNPKRLANKLLFAITLLFSNWTFINLIAWTNIHSDILLFVWPYFAMIPALIAICSIYFIYVFTNDKDAPVSTKLILLALVTPVFIFAHTDLSVSGFNISDCDAFGFESLWYNAYYTAIGAISVLWTSYYLIKKYFTSTKAFKKQILLMGLGIEFFLITFFSITFIASYLANVGLVVDSDLEFYGLYGMAVFMVLISVLVTRYDTFNVGLIASQALIVSLLILVGAQVTYLNTTKISLILTGIAFVLTAVIGFILIRSVKKEIKQKQEIEKLAGNLEKVNDRLRLLDKQKSEFVSIASHQLRSPLTAIRGYVSLIEEGNFGPVPEQMKDALQRVSESGKFMAVSIDDFLNVSRIESGNMKYDLKDINLREQAEHIVEDLRADAMKRGLLLMFKTDITSKGVVNADFGKTQQIFHNLINNALKYTLKGTVTVFVHDDRAKNLIHVEFIDTGIGISPDTLQKLFGKFARAKIASSANIMGTGLGLFVAREMARAMKGDITAHSEGEGKGSRFVLTLPLVM